MFVEGTPSYSEVAETPIGPPKITFRHYMLLFLPDLTDFYATFIVLAMTVLIKNYVFQIPLDSFSLVGIIAYLSTKNIMVVMGILFLCYWGWRWGYVDPEHMVRQGKKKEQEAFKKGMLVFVNMNFYGLIVALIILL